MDLQTIIERDRELAAIDSFVRQATDGPGAMVLLGPAGIGKSTLLQVGIRVAERSGWRVLQARPTEAEANFAFAALADLAGVAFAARGAELPPPQERHLGAALLLVDNPGPLDPRAVAVATATLFELLASDGPLAIVVDDAQWLDAASAGVLGFLMRRMAGPVRWLISSREPDGARLPLGLDRSPSIPPVVIEPSALTFAGIQRLVAEQAGGPLPRPALARVFSTSGGNPYFALELARVIRSSTVPSAYQPLQLPSALQDLATARIAALSDTAREAALLVAASLNPTVAIVSSAMTAPEAAEPSLSEAEAADILVRDGQALAFTHPLLASAVYDAATPGERRQAHRRLAAVVANAEEGAVHLARSVDAADAEVADRIEVGARQAASRGAQDAAAELFDAARRATPNDDRTGLARRSIGAAGALLAAGSFASARESSELALAAAPTPAARADALQLLATMDWFEGRADVATRRVDEALAEVGDDDQAAAGIYARFVRFNFSHDIARAIEYADAAIDRLQDGERPVALAHILIDRFFAGALHGEAVEPATLLRGMALEEDAVDGVGDGPHPVPLLWFHCSDDLAAARRRYAWESSWFRDHGQDVRQADRDSHLAVAELRAGHVDEAARLAAESCAAMDDWEARGPLAMVYEKRALVDAFGGDHARARSALEPLVEAFERDGQPWWAALTLSTLAFTEFSAGDDAAALDLLDRMHRHAAAIGVRDILFDRSEPFEIDARLQRGEVAEARAVLERLDRRNRNVPRPWIEAVLPAARALVQSSEGDTAAALAAFDGPRSPGAPPFETAWSRLVEGRVRRRARQKRAAADALAAALEAFEAIGASPWAERVRGELRRVGLRHARADELTVSERRVAELAASGLTNREVAAAAFMSVKTVEANLARAYGKLGVRSRAELGATMASETRTQARQT